MEKHVSNPTEYRSLHVTSCLQMIMPLTMTFTTIAVFEWTSVGDGCSVSSGCGEVNRDVAAGRCYGVCAPSACWREVSRDVAASRSHGGCAPSACCKEVNRDVAAGRSYQFVLGVKIYLSVIGHYIMKRAKSVWYRECEQIFVPIPYCLHGAIFQSSQVNSCFVLSLIIAASLNSKPGSVRSFQPHTSRDIPC